MRRLMQITRALSLWDLGDEGATRLALSMRQQPVELVQELNAQDARVLRDVLDEWLTGKPDLGTVQSVTFHPSRAALP